jgi:hypothetical protein
MSTTRQVAVKFGFKHSDIGENSDGQNLMEAETVNTARLSGDMFVEYLGRIDESSIPLKEMFSVGQELTFPGLVLELIDGQTVGKTLSMITNLTDRINQMFCYITQYLLLKFDNRP